MINSDSSFNESNAKRCEGHNTEGTVHAYSTERLARLTSIVHEVVSCIALNAASRVTLSAFGGIIAQLTGTVQQKVVL